MVGGRGSEVAGSGGKMHYSRTPDSRSGHTPAWGKAKGTGGLYPKSVEDLLKYFLGSGKHGTGTLICSARKLNKSWRVDPEGRG